MDYDSIEWKEGVRRLEQAQTEIVKLHGALAECRDAAGHGVEGLDPFNAHGYGALACPEEVPGFVADQFQRLRAEVARLSAELDAVRNDRDENYKSWMQSLDRNQGLLDQINAMRQQDPVAWSNGVTAIVGPRNHLAFKMPLYLAPGAQPDAHEEARLVSYAIDGATCTLNIGGVEMYYDRVDRDARPAPSAPEGWKLVPMRATRQMLDAAYDAHDKLEAAGTGAAWCGLSSAYKAMIEAAPEIKP